MSSNLIEAKAALTGCKCKSQVMAVVEAFCGKCRFSYSSDLSLMDNAIIASRKDKKKVSEVLGFADKQLARMK